MGWIGCVRCENIRRDFVARTFALIAPVQPILHRGSCSNEMVPNAPKHYETHQNMSLGPDAWIGWICWKKILMELCGMNFCINYNSLARFEPSIVKQQNRPKCTQTLRNKTWVLGPMGWIGCIHCDKFGHDFVARTIALIAPFQLVLHRVSCSNEMVPNAPKHYETRQ